MKIPDKTLLEFPCDFPIKIFGHHSDEFEIAVLSIIRNHAPDLAEGAVKTRPSQKGKYLAMTVTINAKDKQQIDAIYQELTSHELVVMVL